MQCSVRRISAQSRALWLFAGAPFRFEAPFAAGLEALRKGFYAYSNTFAERPSRRSLCNALSWRNVIRGPLSTSGLLKSIRISEKPPCVLVSTRVLIAKLRHMRRLMTVCVSQGAQCHESNLTSIEYNPKPDYTRLCKLAILCATYSWRCHVRRKLA